MCRYPFLPAGAVLGVLLSAVAAAQSTDAIDPSSGIEQVTVRLDRARSALEPDLGATVYRFGRSSLETLPQGDNIPLNQVLLQAPGVA